MKIEIKIIEDHRIIKKQREFETKGYALLLCSMHEMAEDVLDKYYMEMKDE